MAKVRTDFPIGSISVSRACEAAILYVWIMTEVVPAAVVLNPHDAKSVTEVSARIGEPPKTQKFAVERSKDVPLGTIRIRLP